MFNSVAHVLFKKVVFFSHYKLIIFSNTLGYVQVYELGLEKIQSYIKRKNNYSERSTTSQLHSKRVTS